MKFVILIIFSFVFASCGVKRTVKKLEDSLSGKSSQEVNNKELIDSNGDGVTDLDAIKFNLDPSVAIIPSFSISNISSASLDVYSGENKYQINLIPLGQKTTSRTNILLNINKSIGDGLAFVSEYDSDVLSFGKISSDEYIKLKANFLDKYKIIDRASISFTMELYNGNVPLIDRTILNSLDVVLFNDKLKLIQNKKFEWDGEVVTWKRSESKWGRVEGDINNISLLNKIISSNFYASIKLRDVQYTIPPKKFNFEDQKELIKQKSSEIIFSDKAKTAHYYVGPGKTLEQLCKLLDLDCAENVIYESELNKKIWEMSASEEFTLVSIGMENQKKTFAGKKYYIVKTNQNEVLSVKKEEKQIPLTGNIFTTEKIDPTDTMYLKVKSLKSYESREILDTKTEKSTECTPACSMFIPGGVEVNRGGGGLCRCQEYSCNYTISRIEDFSNDLNIESSQIGIELFKNIVGEDKIFAKSEFVEQYFKLTPNQLKKTTTISIKTNDLLVENEKSYREGVVFSSCQDHPVSFNNITKVSRTSGAFELYKNGIRNE